MGRNYNTVLEITETHIKLLQAKELRGKCVISVCDILSIVDFKKEDEISKGIATLLLKYDVQPDQLLCIIPRRMAILKQIQLPSQQDQEIRKMLELQLGHQIPYPIEEVIFDYIVLRKDPEGYSRVLVAVVHKDISGRYVKLCQRARITINKISVSSFGVAGWWENQLKYLGKFQQKVAMLVNLDIHSTEVCFCHGSRLLFARSINVGREDAFNHKVGSFVSQLELSLKSYKKGGMGPEVDLIVLITVDSVLDVIKKQVSDEFDLPVEFLSPSANISSDRNMKKSDVSMGKDGSLTAGLGFLLSDASVINLTPREVHATKELKQRKLEWIKFGVLLVFVIALGAGILGIQIYHSQQSLATLEQKLKDIKPKVLAGEQKEKKVIEFGDAFKERLFVADIIYALHKVVPKEISLRSLRLDSKGLFVIQGYAETSESVSNFQRSLVQSDVFNKVNMDFATKRRIFNQEVTDFKMTAQVRDF